MKNILFFLLFATLSSATPAAEEYLPGLFAGTFHGAMRSHLLVQFALESRSMNEIVNATPQLAGRDHCWPWRVAWSLQR